MTHSLLQRALAWGLAVLVLLGLAGAALAQPAEVKIALIGPLSGPWARQGALMRLGAEMAVDTINAQGGIQSLGGARLRLVIQDAGDSAEKAKNAAQRLVAQEPDLVGGMGAWLSSFTLAVTEVTERARLPWITLSYSDLITERGFRYVFQTSPTGGTQARNALPTLLDLAESATGRRPRTAAIISDNTAAPLSFAKPMREGGFERLGVKLLVDEIFTPPLSDATPLVQKVRSARPDFLLLLATSVPDDTLILQKLNEFGLTARRLPRIGNGAHLGVPELLQTVGPELLEGLLSIVANWPGKGHEALVAAFRERTGEPWMTQDSLSLYGAVWILKEALERAGVAERDAVAQAIREMDTTSGPAHYFPGGRVKFEANGRRAGAPVVVFQWQNSVPVTVYPPEMAVAKPYWTQ
ncbi:MAG: ABC transporter substrate-binding protein [Candidatus Tectimicrobiota bacterium]|nr:MAG: ABC transporter substrate-binding protein [Candidatus Tectomicrobia bacterium]